MITNENTKVKEWYVATYKSDKLGLDINENITFYDIFRALDNYKDIYKVIGADDSLIRERIFEELAKIMEVDYNYIYEQWLLTTEY